MEMSTICVRIDEKTKREFQNFCDSIGISVSAAIMIFVKSSLNENKLPFEVRGTFKQNKSV